MRSDPAALDGDVSPDGGDPRPDGSAATCSYTDDATFCACMGWNCGGATVTRVNDAKGDFVTVYCGTCASTPGTYCHSAPGYTGVGKCGGNNPIVYPYQRQLINMLEAMGENDTTDYASGLRSYSSP